MPFSWGGGCLADIGNHGEVAIPAMRWTRGPRLYINCIWFFIMDRPAWTLLAMS